MNLRIFGNLLTRFGHLSHTDSLLVSHVAQHREDDEPSKDARPTVNGGEDQAVSEEQ